MKVVVQKWTSIWLKPPLPPCPFSSTTLKPPSPLRVDVLCTRSLPILGFSSTADFDIVLKLRCVSCTENHDGTNWIEMLQKSTSHWGCLTVKFQLQWPLESGEGAPQITTVVFIHSWDVMQCLRNLIKCCHKERFMKLSLCDCLIVENIYIIHKLKTFSLPLLELRNQ